MDIIKQILNTKEIGLVRFGEADFTQLTGLSLVFIAIALISVFTIKEAQDQRKRNVDEQVQENTSYSAPQEEVAVSSPAPAATVESQVTSPQSVKKPSRAKTPTRGRTPKKEAAPVEEEEEERAKTPGRKRATSNRRGRQSEANEVIASPEATKPRGRQPKTPKA